MDDTPDPATQFFPDVPPEEIDLYATLNLERTASPNDIKSSYRKLALRFHPDKQSHAAEDVKKEAHTKFQQIGFAYAVLGDETRRAKYDKTGRTDESSLDPGEGGWESYFEDLFDKVTKGKLDEMKKEYQGSDEELANLREAYLKGEGSIEIIMSEIPHSTYEDEPRFVKTLKPLIKSGELPSFPAWEVDLKDTKGRQRRKQEGQKEAKEAEEHAKELGVWDEFYGSGKPTARKGKADSSTGNADESILQAMILKRQGKREAIFDSLLSKYGGDQSEEDPKRPAKKRKGQRLDDDEAEEEVNTSRKTKTSSAKRSKSGR